MSVLGKISKDPAAVILGTGFDQFTSTLGIDGLAKVTGRRLDILAVINPTEEHGNFRRFIDACKAEFETVCVWEIMNPIIESALLRYGFTPEVEIDRFGAPLEGMRWDRIKQPTTPPHHD